MSMNKTVAETAKKEAEVPVSSCFTMPAVMLCNEQHCRTKHIQWKFLLPQQCTAVVRPCSAGANQEFGACYSPAAVQYMCMACTA